MDGMRLNQPCESLRIDRFLCEAMPNDLTIRSSKHWPLTEIAPFFRRGNQALNLPIKEGARLSEQRCTGVSPDSSPKVSPDGQCGGGNPAMRSIVRASEKALEPPWNKARMSLETECVRLGTVKLPRSIPTLASNDLR